LRLVAEFDLIFMDQYMASVEKQPLDQMQPELSERKVSVR
jgi:hypothetical protein